VVEFTGCAATEYHLRKIVIAAFTANGLVCWMSVSVNAILSLHDLAATNRTFGPEVLPHLILSCGWRKVNVEVLRCV